MAPEDGATCGFFPIDSKTLEYMRLTGRPEATIALAAVVGLGLVQLYFTLDEATQLTRIAIPLGIGAVLGWLGGFEPGPGHKVVTIPYAGGKPKLLAKNAFEPDWNR